MRAGHNSLAHFETLSFTALTGFFAFEVKASDGGQEEEIRFALNLPLLGAPDDRREGLLRALLRDREQVMRLLWILLSEEDLSVSDLVNPGGGDNGRRAQAGFSGSHFPLLEALLKALGRDPGRLDEVARLIADLRRTPEGRELLPEDLDAIWEPIWSVHQENAGVRVNTESNES
jgi:hypothetical protein